MPGRNLKNMKSPPPKLPKPPCILRDRERHVVRAVAEGLYDAKVEGAFPTILMEVEAWLGELDFTTLTALRALLVAIELSPICFGFGPSRMSRLTISDRQRYLAVLDTRGSSMLILWKTLVGAAYFATPIGESELSLDHRPLVTTIKRRPLRPSPSSSHRKQPAFFGAAQKAGAM
jgi:hypothetical protein